MCCLLVFFHNNNTLFQILLLLLLSFTTHLWVLASSSFQILTYSNFMTTFPPYSTLYSICFWPSQTTHKIYLKDCCILGCDVMENGKTVQLLQSNLLPPSSGLHLSSWWRLHAPFKNWQAASTAHRITPQQTAFFTETTITTSNPTKFTLPNELTFFTIAPSSSFRRGSWHCTANRMQSSTVSTWVSSLAVYMYCRSDLNALGRTCQHMCVLQEWLECTQMHLSTYIRSAGGTWMHLNAPVNIHMYCRRDLNVLRHTYQHTHVLQEWLECTWMHVSTYIRTAGVTWMHSDAPVNIHMHYRSDLNALRCTCQHTYVLQEQLNTLGRTCQHNMYCRSDLNALGRTFQHTHVLQEWL